MYLEKSDFLDFSNCFKNHIIKIKILYHYLPYKLQLSELYSLEKQPVYHWRSYFNRGNCQWYSNLYG